MIMIIIRLSLELEVRNGSPFVSSFSLSSLIQYSNSFKFPLFSNMRNGVLY